MANPPAPTSFIAAQAVQEMTRAERELTNYHKTLEAMWPGGEWCPSQYLPVSGVSKGILSAMQSLTRLYIREGKPLRDLWGEDDNPGILVQVIRERTRRGGRLSTSVAAEALRRAKVLVSALPNGSRRR